MGRDEDGDGAEGRVAVVLRWRSDLRRWHQDLSNLGSLIPAQSPKMLRRAAHRRMRSKMAVEAEDEEDEELMVELLTDANSADS